MKTKSCIFFHENETNSCHLLAPPKNRSCVDSKQADIPLS